MAVERPTFSESWYRLADIRPRLRSTIRINRQHFRGQMWYVVEDRSSNQYFRLNIPAYRFVAMLDGRSTVAEVWHRCNEELGDSAPTQGEAIELLGQLYASNLLQTELPPDAAGLFERYKKRKRREVQSYMTNLLFLRIPLIDPDNFLDKWVHIFGKIFTGYGLVVWIGLVVAALWHLAGRVDDLYKPYQEILSPENMPLLYVAGVLIKVCHEFGHAFSCKHFGRLAGAKGEVHTMGVMFLVFMPLPYVDASSAWVPRSKWHKVTVGAGGMYVEMAIASIAAIIWARTAEGRPSARCATI
ncbi:MAG: PqqD family protein [Planctomycetes bacterium]|nr:PqqD family protein [Planctomycetota bacterium]